MTSKPPRHLNHPDKAARASFAKHTINTIIPHILQHNARAKAGNESTEKIYYSPDAAKTHSKHFSPGRGSGRGRGRGQDSNRGASSAQQSDKGKITGFFKPITPKKQEPQDMEGTTVKDEREKHDDEANDGDEKDGNVVASSSATPKSQPKISVIQADTLDAAHQFVDPTIKDRRISVLNMASFLRPGGGVINGAIAQEESLCLRSTLYTALDERFYRLPKFGGLFTKDILVFRDSKNQDLPKSDWYFVDVISVAALKRPDLITTSDGEELYEYEQDKEEMISKIKLILLMALKHKSTHLILGALGCGAYHNPPEEVAKMFRRVMLGNSKGKGAMDLSGIEEIVFAIFDDGVNLKVFKEYFEEDVSVSSGSGDGERVYPIDKTIAEDRKDVEMGDA